MVEIQVRQQSPACTIPQWWSDGSGRLGQTADAFAGRGTIHTLQLRLFEIKRQLRRQVTVAAGSVNDQRSVIRHIGIELQIHEIEKNICTFDSLKIVQLCMATGRKPESVIFIILMLMFHAVERQIFLLFSRGRRSYYFVNRMYLVPQRTAGIGHYLIFQSRMVDLDRIGSVVEQIHDRRAPEDKSVGRNIMFQLYIRAVQVDIKI